ncbi:MAG: PTS cellobiose transporter subunit IIB [Lactobacillaceae bacterium]|jgi:PTS system cellobiose-specific IIB component|nr:PTS cellobiose transporter subunit IIB [Lactobacillaceae bacterium]
MADKNILLIDAAGMSISLLAKKMDDYSKTNNLGYSVEGVADSAGPEKIESNKPIAIMIAPQVSYLFDKYEKEYGKDIPVGKIEMVSYGMMDAPKVIKATEDVISSKK